MSTTFFDFLRERRSTDAAALRPHRFVSFLQLVWKVRRERAQLSKLTQRDLADIGIHPDVARREAARDLFDLPRSRLDRF